jgi:hypothetical protein
MLGLMALRASGRANKGDILRTQRYAAPSGCEDGNRKQSSAEAFDAHFNSPYDFRSMTRPTPKRRVMLIRMTNLADPRGQKVSNSK